MNGISGTSQYHIHQECKKTSAKINFCWLSKNKQFDKNKNFIQEKITNSLYIFLLELKSIKIN